MYRYIFFDLDGTLTDSKEGIINCVLHAMKTMGKEIPSDEVLLKFIGPSLKHSFTTYCGFTEEEVVQATALFRERYVAIGKFENMPAPGMLELCRRLKARGYHLAVATSKPQIMCDPICEKFEFTPEMDTVTGIPIPSDWSKADVIRETMRRLGLTEEDKPSILMVGDRKFDVLGAKECGIGCLGVDFFHYAEPGELEEAGALAVAHTVEEAEAFILKH